MVALQYLGSYSYLCTAAVYGGFCVRQGQASLDDFLSLVLLCTLGFLGLSPINSYVRTRVLVLEYHTYWLGLGLGLTLFFFFTYERRAQNPP